MSANLPETAGADTADRDLILRRLLGCFAAAALVALGMAVTTAAWQQASGPEAAPVSLVQDSPK